MRARKPLQLAPRTVTSDTIRSRSTYNNDLYGGARPREAVLAARGTTRQYPRYPSAAHISLAASCLASHSPLNYCPFCSASDHSLGINCPVFPVMFPDDFRGPGANPNNCPWCDANDHSLGVDCPVFPVLYPQYLEPPHLQDAQNKNPGSDLDTNSAVGPTTKLVDILISCLPFF
jgi:hypothetical protein